MKKNLRRLPGLIALVLAMLMMLSLAACSGEEAPAESTQTPAVTETQAPAEDTATHSPSPEDTLLPTATPVPTANSDGQLTFTSMSKGFSFQYDEKYIALSNQTDNAMIYPAGDTTLPYCSVSLVSDTDAVSYLKEIAAGAMIEMEGSLSTAPGEPVSEEIDGREIYTVSYAYSYEDESVSGTVICVYYAEDVAEGQVAVYSSTALEADSETVGGILALAIESFKLS